MPAPVQPKIYHILHVDKLASVLAKDALLCDRTVVAQNIGGTNIGMSSIKQRRLTLPIPCHQNLCVGECVPFYFCGRSVMLYLIHCANHAELTYKGGQTPILHLEADLNAVVKWANANNRKWAFTLSNAGAFYFEDRCDLARLGDVNWGAIQARQWAGNGVSPDVKEGKQAEFLVEDSVPWNLIERIGVYSAAESQRAANIIRNANHRPTIEIKSDWYY